MESVGFADLLDMGDVSALQFRGGAGLLQEAMKSVLVTRNVGGKNFQRHRAIQLGVVSKINLSHSARANLGRDLVAT